LSPKMEKLSFECGSNRHFAGNSWVKTITCHKCGQKGHPKKMCQSARRQL
jgi:hypothetical protein